jgi:hypothetical protein
MKAVVGVGAALAPVGKPSDQKLPPQPACGALPLDYFLRSLAPASPYLTQLAQTVRADFSSAVLATPIEIGTIEVPLGTSFVILSYAFFALEPDSGARRALLGDADLQGLVQLQFTINGRQPMRASYSDSSDGVNFGGPAFLNDFRDQSRRIPIYVHGTAQITARYLVNTVPDFDIDKIGFTLDGFTIPTTRLKPILDDMIAE